jgi:hypothetical protein
MPGRHFMDSNLRIASEVIGLVSAVLIAILWILTIKTGPAPDALVTAVAPTAIVAAADVLSLWP